MSDAFERPCASDSWVSAGKFGNLFCIYLVFIFNCSNALKLSKLSSIGLADIVTLPVRFFNIFNTSASLGVIVPSVNLLSNVLIVVLIEFLLGAFTSSICTS